MAELPIDFHPEARREADAAFEYYFVRSAKTAQAYFQTLESSLASLRKSPEIWANYLHGTRRYLLERFPYVVVYRVTDRRIEIVAVAHGHRKPGYWVDRLK